MSNIYEYKKIVVRYEIVKTFEPTVVVDNADVEVLSLIDAIEMAERRCNFIRTMNETGGRTGKEPVNQDLLAIRVGSVKIVDNVRK
jgi:hypothetical protein